MFTVKAEVRALSGESYQIFQAASVHVAPPQAWQSNVIAPDFVVELQDDQNNSFRHLNVGHAPEHFRAIYVMNEKGKTIQSIYPGPLSYNEPVSVVVCSATPHR